MSRFHHNRLAAYRRTLEFIRTADAVVQSMPPGRSALGDQLFRASTSIALNLAEGAGEYAPREKARFYRMARRSASECAGIMDVAQVLEIIGDELHDEACATLYEIASMLTGLVRGIEERASRTASKGRSQR